MLDVLIDQLGSAGGPVLIALVAVSIVATTVAIFKVVQLARMGAGRSRAARNAVAIWATGDRARALDEAARETSPASATVVSAMKSLIRHPGDRQRAQEIAGQTALDQLTELSRYLRILESVVQAAPMMGLLGTVIGMISAFGELSQRSGAIDPSALATGIWAALLTTAAGLAIAIPFYFVWVWLDSRVEDERATMDAAIGAVLSVEAGADSGQRGAAREREEPGTATRPATA
ncbi:flagellar motor protein MotA [Mesorhizobium sp. L-8-10]|uniref:MotA/TolQ/ExbB proton channel family protein n=1 Tax=Mesorhizobium sp. L-8-10 TaxID=2744523 RepID=UPI001928DA0B|nr:MotA/TolQ/ExbB proton channel family protein [Mesorhizobium sp. L-8-10]BCH33453.1 flagellar motor protein MotA [Mesorhizobium sp. L-8-10]